VHSDWKADGGDILNDFEAGESCGVSTSVPTSEVVDLLQDRIGFGFVSFSTAQARRRKGKCRGRGSGRHDEKDGSPLLAATFNGFAGIVGVAGVRLFPPDFHFLPAGIQS